MLADRLEFLIGVGHDMRAPLTGIAGFAAVLTELESVAADPTAGEAVAYIRKEAQRLVELLNQLLDFGVVEQGGPKLDREPIDLARMARQAVEPWAIRHPEVTFKLVDHGNATVEGDFLKLHRVLANLLDNAVRHSPERGTITVDVGGDDTDAYLSVTDEGAGVPPEDRDRVFQRFVSLASDPVAGDGRKRGPGIGLYVVKGLVEAHGGSVIVEQGPAEEGSGARFIVKIPIRRETAHHFEGPETHSRERLDGNPRQLAANERDMTVPVRPDVT
jgi:signal transduction histidine kinase